MKRSRYSDVTAAFVKACSAFDSEETTVIDLAPVLATLPHVHLKSGLVLEGITPDASGHEGVTGIYARRETEAPLQWQHKESIFGFKPHAELPPHIDPFDAVDIKFSRDGVWEAFLLSDAHCFLPVWWHAHYIRHTIFTEPSDLTEELAEADARAQLLMRPGWSMRKAQNYLRRPSSRPRVFILSPHYAIVHYVDWNDWSGLVRKRLLVRKKYGHFYFSTISRRTLVKYDCGVRY